MTSSHAVINALSSPAATQQLQSFRAVPDLLTKWQQTNAMLVQATLHAGFRDWLQRTGNLRHQVGELAQPTW